MLKGGTYPDDDEVEHDSLSTRISETAVSERVGGNTMIGTSMSRAIYCEISHQGYGGGKVDYARGHTWANDPDTYVISRTNSVPEYSAPDSSITAMTCKEHMRQCH
jgi:hypothetical protein